MELKERIFLYLGVVAIELAGAMLVISQIATGDAVAVLASNIVFRVAYTLVVLVTVACAYTFFPSRTPKVKETNDNK